jgi:hypothetical protein
MAPNVMAGFWPGPNSRANTLPWHADHLNDPQSSIPFKTSPLDLRGLRALIASPVCQTAIMLSFQKS